MPHKDQTIALLLTPAMLERGDECIQLLSIEKEGKATNLSHETLTAALVNQYFSTLPPNAQSALKVFTTTALKKIKAEIAEQYKLQKVGKDYDSYFQSSFYRQLHQQFRVMKPFFVCFKWYHQTHQKGKKKNTTTTSCVFSTTTPSLCLQVVHTAEKNLSIDVRIKLQDISVPLSDCNRTKFFLDIKNEYFVLNYKDYVTLEWLSALDWQQAGASATLFAENVLRTLEENYVVERNGLMSHALIDTTPTLQILLSEISSTFLVLTPQYNYNGFVLEGKHQDKQIIHKNGVVYEVDRKKEIENNFTTWVESFHPNFSKQINGYFYLSFEDAKKKQWFVKVYQQLQEKNVSILGMSMLKHFRYSNELATTSVKLLKEQNHQLSLEVDVYFGKELVPNATIQKALRSGQQAVLLKDGSIGLLHEEWLVRHSRLFKHAIIISNQLIVPKWLSLTQNNASPISAIFEKTIAPHWQARWLQWQQSPTVLYALPAAIDASLRPYQQKGYEWMRLLNEIGAGACLADDMGLGKTLQTICFLASQLELLPDQKILIVCPASLIYNWQNELKKFAPSIVAEVYHGGGRNKAALVDTAYQILISSYGTVRADEDIFTALYFSTIVLDESHTIKNPNAQVSKIIQQLQAGSKIVLSGTPILNNTFDLYGQLHFCLPNLLGSQEFFRKEYADPIDKEKNKEKIAELQKLSAPFILRRTKEQVAKDLPAKTELILWCEMEKQQQSVYEEIRSQIEGEVLTSIKKQGLQKSKLFVLQGIMKLRQVCNSPLLLKDKEYPYEDSIKTNELLAELINNLSSHKVLVFSQFTSMLAILSEKLKENNIPHFKLTGATPPKERNILVQQFNDMGNPHRVFLLSLKAGNAGINLTAADYVFLFDPWWNTAIEQQAIDRAHRIGQTKNVFAYKMICKNTIEEKIVQLQQKKKKLAENIISEEDGFVKTLSEEEIAFLFS
jgi:superfamily II DNA or RNA helicase